MEQVKHGETEFKRWAFLCERPIMCAPRDIKGEVWSPGSSLKSNIWLCLGESG